MAYINNVLYYIDLNLKRSSEDKLIEVGKLLFPEKEIIEAKQYLLDNCQSVLLRLNKTLADEVKKGRKNTENLPKVDVTIKNIIDRSRVKKMEILIFGQKIHKNSELPGAAKFHLLLFTKMQNKTKLFVARKSMIFMKTLSHKSCTKI